MNKTAIKNYAIWARVNLIEAAKQKAFEYEITENGEMKTGIDSVGGRLLSKAEKEQRNTLIAQIRQKGFNQVMEEVAYTWFNRFIALRFMEVNGYLPSKIRIFTDENGAFKPEILKEATRVELEGIDRDTVIHLLDKQDNEGLYKYLLITQCNALNAALPGMFEKIANYTELLFPNNLLKQDSVLGHMVTDIPEEDWTDQVQIIGWLYQYYNSELKDDTFALLKKNVKITKERIPSATQLFTPDWIVRYMVENSLGRIFIDKCKNEGVFADGRGADEMTWEESEAKRIANEKYIAEQMGWKYYLPEAEQTEEVRQQLDEIQRENANLDVKEIKVIDPCMGSGHILVYAFDVLMQIYEANGYSQRDAAQSILENNLYGLDIDDRAAQLAYFAVMMKARQYDRRIFSRGIQPHVYAIVESNGLDRSTIDYFTNNDPKLQKDFGTLVDELRDAKEYGSILNISQVDFTALYARIDEVRDDISIFREVVLSSYLPLIQVAEVMARKYDVVVTNPPYMGSRGGMDAKLYDYVNKVYPNSKADLYSVFMERCHEMTLPTKFYAMITQHGWMFLTSFAELRNIILHDDIVNLHHLGPRAFDEISGEVVQSVSFVNRRTDLSDHRGLYTRLLSGNSEKEKEALSFDESLRYSVQKRKFNLLAEKSIAYWLSEQDFQNFDNPTLGEYAKPRQGMATSDNDRFLRLWHEIGRRRMCISAHNSQEAIDSRAKWFPYNKGGGFRKWYGNNDYVINWENDGLEVKGLAEKLYRCVTRTIKNIQFYFQEGVTWSTLASGSFNARYSGYGFLFDTKGSTCFFDKSGKIPYFTAFLNSTVANEYLKVLAPTLDYNAGSIAKIPVIYKPEKNELIEPLFNDCVEFARQDWDSFETSWDFSRHPLVPLASERQEQEISQLRSSRMEKFGRIAWHYEKWSQECEDRFAQLKANEEELNRIFIDIYGLQDELTPEVEDKDVTVRKADLGRDIRSLMSYAVGCMFGRYSLDEPGLAYAGGEWDASKYSTIIPDKDNIIPICDDDYFDDDITGRFVKWVETVYGSETLEENLKFIADALGGKGTPREVIRSYFINDFYADHLKTYQKRPIYWLFDSGKKNGFKALIYMHRYQSDLLARMRTDYVHEQQERYRTQLSMLEDSAQSAAASDRVKLNKQIEKLRAQEVEIRSYEEKIHHLADQMIAIDLDDGVKVNYEKFKDVLAKIK